MDLSIPSQFLEVISFGEVENSQVEERDANMEVSQMGVIDSLDNPSLGFEDEDEMHTNSDSRIDAINPQIVEECEIETKGKGT